MDEDVVFRALAAPTRRKLLDELRRRDGQSLSELGRKLPMSRFGVMKHLGVLEEANLVVSRRQGREKLHYLNPVPIRLIHDRWVSKYAEPLAATLSGPEERARGGRACREYPQAGAALYPDDTAAVFEVFIKTTPERLWEAITDADLRARSTASAFAPSRTTPAAPTTSPSVPGVIDIAEGENLEVDPPVASSRRSPPCGAMR